MPDAILEQTFVALCDWHGRLTWASVTDQPLQVGEFVWEHLADDSHEKAKSTVARVVTLRESQRIEVRNQRGEHYRAWLWPLDAPEAAVCFLGIRIPDELTRLTERERDCLRLLAEGLATRAIAAELDVSVSTVHTHLRRAREKLELPTAEALIGFAARYCRAQAAPKGPGE
jgi:DNA-binding CsgD family transcriptional regulator